MLPSKVDNHNNRLFNTLTNFRGDGKFSVQGKDMIFKNI